MKEEIDSLVKHTQVGDDTTLDDLRADIKKMYQTFDDENYQ